MILQVEIKPNPFKTSVQIEVTCEYSRQVIVRMFNETGRIVKMFSWYLVTGSNVTAINELQKIEDGLYLIDIINHEGDVLYSERLSKQ